MAAHSLDTLLRLWALNQLSSEQAIGQVLQILQDMEPRLKRLEQSVTTPAVVTAPAAPPVAPSPPPARNVSSSARRRRTK